MNRTNEVRLVGQETVENRRAWRVEVTLETTPRPWTFDFWIDVERPERVVRLQSSGHQTTVVSTFEDSSDPIPTVVTMLERRDGVPYFESRLVRSKNRYNVPIDPDTWGAKGLMMALGTPLIDTTRHETMGYWDGEKLSNKVPRVDPVPQERAPNLHRLLDLVSRDPQSPFAITPESFSTSRNAPRSTGPLSTLNENRPVLRAWPIYATDSVKFGESACGPWTSFKPSWRTTPMLRCKPTPVFPWPPF